MTGKTAGKTCFLLAIAIPIVVLAYVFLFPKDFYLEKERALNRLCEDARTKVGGSSEAPHSSGPGAGMPKAVLSECERNSR